MSQEIRALNALGYLHLRTRTYDESLAYFTRAQDLIRQHGSDLDRAMVLANLSQAYYLVGRFDVAGKLAAEALAACPGTAPSLVRGRIFLATGVLEMARRNWGEALRNGQQALDLFLAAGNDGYVARALNNVGIAHLELDHLESAHENLSKAFLLNTKSDAFGELARNCAELGRVYHLLGQPSRALQSGLTALNALLTDVSILDKAEVARLCWLFGSIFWSAGNRNLALKNLNRATTYFAQLNMLHEWDNVNATIAGILSGSLPGGRGPNLDEPEGLEYLAAILDLSDEMEGADPHLRRHSEQVAIYSMVIARKIELGRPLSDHLCHAARLHDVGKVTFDQALLQKGGPLSAREAEVMKQHPVIGEDMVHVFNLSPECLQAIRFHHESFDGSGYPGGLAGEGIPLLARIIAVADVYDSLTNDRSFRPAMSHSVALEELRALARSRLDPRLVQAFCEIHERREGEE
ncbi:MAG: tetratricopeptide repeat protein [Firmicutes bacterium]|nr:tetratricopeptide repeat protein [Bacillota bacterium]